MARFPNHYEVLSIRESATEAQIRKAYQREALRTHPDRTANASARDKRRAEKRFQAVADAYYVLSDPTWRRDYQERLARSRKVLKRFFRMFRCGSGGIDDRFIADADHIFAEVFAEKLNARHRGRASWVLFAGNAGLGYIVADTEGASVGAMLGSALDRQRDARVFEDLEANQKAEILRALARQI
ncbi:hypothetical protein MSAN_00278900 [Mycena sanguinolenta]|uniref:J domain-containing protein n=1 Tax=Mycena sanguinolenta TaxID=230812 RepID=A0A8H6ZGE2_9AGAR|nr:hypothetical protein MSAN_00278900 [Mycena sanguinolenta]